jgi:hypothetical protein
MPMKTARETSAQASAGYMLLPGRHGDISRRWSGLLALALANETGVDLTSHVFIRVIT